MLRHFMRIDIDNDLLTAMVERWRPEVHAFHFPEGEMTITLIDVALLTGLPVTGEAIIGNPSKPEGGWGPLILEHLGFNMPTTTPVQGVGHPPLNAGQVSIPWLVEHIQQEVNLGPDTPKDQVERYARVYLIGLVGGFLFPDKANWWIQGMWERNKLEVRCSYSNSRHGSIFQCSLPETRGNFGVQMMSYTF
ncbi:unnamed protein product [Linum tenue]|uniref:Aminotransferase-like plant mobile domain-containing protein n=1 Tax=Linum tenue TaxID=586396 RepID=A0AAV0MLF7_9ROSI|nr:unnamed protein product [Linum tenue]